VPDDVGAERGRRYGGLDAEERREERRGRLLAAALELYGTAGYNPTTITDVCRAAGVAPAHFYELFDSREGLLRSVYDGIVSETRAVVQAALAGEPDDAAARARAGLAAFCDDLMTDPRRARIQSIEVVGVSAGLEAHRHGVIRSYADLLLAQFAGIGATSDLATLRVLATALVGGVNEAIIDWLLTEERPPVSVVVEGLTVLYGAVARTLA
jgi:AcrR family transcriptional regulator